MAIKDFLKNAASKIISPLGAPDLGQKLFGTAPKTPVQTPAYTPAPTQGAVQGPVRPTSTGVMQGPVQPQVTASPITTAPALRGSGYTQDQINQAAQAQRFSDSISVPTATTVSASALSPDNTMSGLLNTLREKREAYLKTFEPNDNLRNLAQIQNEEADVMREYDDRIAALESNPEGVFGPGALNSQLAKVRAEKNKELAYIATKKLAAQGMIDADEKTQANLLKGIEQITKLTNKEMVGNQQVDDVTGDVYGFFRDPSTGLVSQEKIGTTTPKGDYTYMEVGDSVIAIDKRTNTASKVYGTDTDPRQFASDASYYANEYAATGIMPKNMEKGINPSMVAELAKDIPKNDGALVSRYTGVQPASSSVGIDYQKGITSFSHLARNTLPQLLEVYPKLITGGKLNPFTTEERQKYETLSKAFLQELLLARSGNAVTEEEFRRYEALLPKNLDQLTGTGVKKLREMSDDINKNLQNKLDAKGLSIFGYSKVMVDGEERTVGEEVVAPNGQTGFIGPDGLIHVPPQPGDTGGQQASGNVPQRNNNPGNIKSGGVADNWALGTDEQGHLIFPDAETGFQAFAEDVRAKVSGNSRHLPPNPTIQQLGSVYAEDPNWPFAVARMLGVPVGTPTQDIAFEDLLQAIATQEGFYA